MTKYDLDLIDLADWRQELPPDWVQDLQEGEAEALRAVKHRAVQDAALDGQISLPYASIVAGTFGAATSQ